MMRFCLLAIVVLCTVIVLSFIFARIWLQRRKKHLHRFNKKTLHIGFFHPYCNAGGGGERVLWCAKKYNNTKIVIYTGDLDSSPTSILDKAQNVFNIALELDTISFVFLKQRHWIEAQKYPVFTILGQSIGSMILGMEALFNYPPDIFVDTMGYPFTFPIFKFLGCSKISCYFHYPVISTDMLRRVQVREPSYNNGKYITRNPFLSWTKLIYYRIFAKMYKWVSDCAETVMVNSTWTENHIIELLKIPFKTHRVYPPCDVTNLARLEHSECSDKIIILSVGQFRPEKNHPLQLHALYELRTILNRNEALWNKICLVIVGSCRNKFDYDRLKNIQDLAKHLSLENNVDFKVNSSYEDLLHLYSISKIGLHTMVNEHFGIGIVECMAAGLIMIAHNSGGPALDIIETTTGCQTGFLATDAVEYANCILTVIQNSNDKNLSIRNAARASVERFSELEFEEHFLRSVSSLFTDSQ